MAVILALQLLRIVDQAVVTVPEASRQRLSLEERLGFRPRPSE